MTDSPDAIVRDAQACQRQGRVPEAIAAYQRVLARWPGLADSWYNLGYLLRQARQPEAALEAYQRALDCGVVRPEEVHLNRSVIYADFLRQDAAAERELRAALACNPAFGPALLNLANLCEDLGRRDEACALYEQLLAREPRHYEALARYANLQPADGAHGPLVARLRAALADVAATAAEQASLGFALGRLLDAAGDYASAFAAYEAANRASRASAAPGGVRYDRREAERWTGRLIGAPPVRAAAASPASPQPIFICGMFRSGSTLAEQLLAGVPGLAAGGELDLLPSWVADELAPYPESLATLPPQRLEQLADRYLAALRTMFPGAAYVTDKRPDNFQYLGLIKTLFPAAKIVHTTRDPLDNCLSIYFLHLDHRMGYALDLADIGHHYREYRRLMAHWRQRYGADIVDFDYDAFVREPEQAGAALCEALSLPWDPRLLERPRTDRAVRTASVWQVREPLYRRSSGRARHYRPQLAALRATLADLPAGAARATSR